MSNKVLVLFAHPAQEYSEVNMPMFDIAKNAEGVTCVDLYLEYPKHDIDVKVEQERLLLHDVVIFLFPLYWYSTPAILKDWMDLVLQYGFAYGHDGNALKDKLFLPVISTGGPEIAYCEEGINHFGLRELLRPLEQTANFCGMHFITPLVIFGARTAVEENRLDQHLQQWQQLLAALVDDRLDIDKAKDLEHLSIDLDGVIQ